MGKDLRGKELGRGIRQIQSGRYEARYVDRFGKRKSLYGGTLAEVRNKLSQAIKENASGTSVKQKLTVKQWYQIWLDTYKRPVVRPSTIRRYKEIFEVHIFPTLGEMYLEEVRQIHIQKLINTLDDAGYGWETQSKVKILMHDLFDVAIDNAYAICNPVKGIRMNKNNAEERIVLTVEQQKDFFKCAAGTFYYNFFVVMVNTGLRPGEAFALQMNDLDFENRRIVVDELEGTLFYQKLEGDSKKTFHLGPPKTKSSIRTVPMNESCAEALKQQLVLKQILDKRYPRNDGFENLIFKSQINHPLCSQTMNDAIKRIVNEMNLQRDVTDQVPVFSAHSFRHTFATRCLENGIQPKILQKYLGHATLGMTMDLYVHITDDFAQDQMEKIGDIETFDI